MESVLSVKEMKEIEALTLKELKLSDVDLMQHAGQELTKDFIKRVKPEIHDVITVVSSVGNNGGDGLVMFLELLKLGYKPKMLVIGSVDHATKSFNYYFNQVAQETKVTFLTKDNDLDVQRVLISSKYIIDGIFGAGLSRPVEGKYLDLIRYINGLEKIIYSIDIPSGIHPDNGLLFNESIKANYTGVIGFYKYGNIINDALDYHGDISVLDIGLVKKHDVLVKLINEEDFSIEAKKRKHNSYKYHYGLGYFIGGSKTMPGAINLSVLAALRSGQGIAHVFQENPVARHLEVIYEDINQDIDFSKVDSVVFGPGLKPNIDHYQKIYRDINHSEIKTVIDAGGLKYFDLDNIKNPNMIITPHEKEFSDLFSVGVNEVEHHPFDYIKTIVDKGVTLILKGQTNVIANKKHIYLYQAKNPGLATAGSGDVLSGIISSYLIDDSPLSACIKAVLLHSKAARYARDTYGEVSMIASDIINHIHLVLKGDKDELSK
ncbi:NAD(P)H-hydrate dehydratase [Mycoplasmatota bacterium]|nr:NAD(P)H-hydrate dehydratase [Mycoplasmatota bacterium]